MKNYKLVIISLLLLIFMVGAVSAADENVADDNLEISDEVNVDEVNVDEEVASSDIDEEESGEVLEINDEEDVIGEGEVLFEEGDQYAVEGQNYTYTAQFLHLDENNTPYVGASVSFLVYGDSEDGNYVERTYNAVTDENGYARFLIDLPAGEYDIDVTNPEGGIDYGYLEVIPLERYRQPVISLSNQYIFVIGESMSFRARVTDGFGRQRGGYEVNYVVGNLTGSAETDVRGNANFIIELPVGQHNITFSCPSLGANKTTTAYILAEAIPSVYADNVVMVKGDETKLVVTITDKLGNPLTQNFCQLKFDDGTPVYGAFEGDGVVSRVINLDVGYHFVRITNTNTYEIIFRNITVLAEPSIVQDDGVSDNISAVFKDINGTALVNTTVNFIVGEDNYSITTDENGVANFDLALLGLGEFNVTILNPVTGQEVTKSISLTTDETIFASDVSAVYNDGSKFTVKFTDKYGKPLVNTSVNLTVNSELARIVTDANGTATFTIDFSAGSYNVTITNPATGQVITKTITVNPLATKLTAPAVTTVYNVAKNLIVTLKDDNGNAIANAKITINLNGKATPVTTDKNGQAKLSVNLPAKTYTATITYNGDNNHVKSTTTANVVVNKASPKMIAKKKTFKTKTKKYTITLKDNKGKAMKKVKVTLTTKVKGKKVKLTVKTNNKGKVTFNLKKLTKKGKYTATVKFAGNKNYKAVTKSVKITVKK